MFTSHRLSACRVRTTRYFSHSRSPSRSEPIYSHPHNTILTHSPVSLLISRGVIQRLPPRSPHLPLRVGAQPTAVAASRHLRPLHRMAEPCPCPPASLPRWRVGARAALARRYAGAQSERERLSDDAAAQPVNWLPIICGRCILQNVLSDRDCGAAALRHAGLPPDLKSRARSDRPAGTPRVPRAPVRKIETRPERGKTERRPEAPGMCVRVRRRLGISRKPRQSRKSTSGGGDSYDLYAARPRDATSGRRGAGSRARSAGPVFALYFSSFSGVTAGLLVCSVFPSAARQRPGPTFPNSRGFGRPRRRRRPPRGARHRCGPHVPAARSAGRVQRSESVTRILRAGRRGPPFRATARAPGTDIRVAAARSGARWRALPAGIRAGFRRL